MPTRLCGAQVFEFIMQSLANYRSMHQRMQALHRDAAEGMYDKRPDMTSQGKLSSAHERKEGFGLDGSHLAGMVQPPQHALLSDMDAFTQRLNAIVHSDFTNAALMSGPLDVPLGKHRTRVSADRFAYTSGTLF